MRLYAVPELPTGTACAYLMRADRYSPGGALVESATVVHVEPGDSIPAEHLGEMAAALTEAARLLGWTEDGH